MKRERDDEVVQASAYFKRLYDEARDANARNMAVQLFSHEDIFTTMLYDRPLSVLRLLSTSQQLYGLLKHLPNFFLFLLELVVLTRAPTRGYAFYVWEFHTGLFRQLMQRVVAGEFGVGAFNFVCADYLHYNITRNAKSALFDSTNRFQSKEMLGHTLFPGDGADIVHAAEPQAHTTMCEILQFDRQVQTRWNIAPQYLTQGQRELMCRIYTYSYPFSLGPFVFLDTRRLFMHRAFLHAMSGMSSYISAPRRDPLMFEYAEIVVRALRQMVVAKARYDPQADQRTVESTADRKRVEYSERVFDNAIRAFENVDVDAALADDLQRLRAVAAQHRSDEVRAFLAQDMPAPYVFLDDAPYRAQLAAFYRDPFVGRQALVAELAYLERTAGKTYVESSFGQCVQCAGDTETVDTQRMVFMCEACHSTT